MKLTSHNNSPLTQAWTVNSVFGGTEAATTQTARATDCILPVHIPNKKRNVRGKKNNERNDCKIITSAATITTRRRRRRRRCCESKARLDLT